MIIHACSDLIISGYNLKTWFTELVETWLLPCSTNCQIKLKVFLPLAYFKNCASVEKKELSRF